MGQDGQGRRHAPRTPLIHVALLLTVGVGLPIEGRFSWLRGRRAIDREVESASAAGYYEALLDAGGSAGGKGRTPIQAVARPPGWVLFVESGIILHEPGYRRWRMRPNVDEVWNGKRFRTNSLGYRSPEVTLEKPPGTYRIVVLGSSNTMGHGVEDDAVYVRLLETWLNEAVAPKGPRVEVINLASAGESPSQRLLRLREEVDRLNPDWILFDASVVDPSLEELHLEQMARTRATIPLGYVQEALGRAGVSADDPTPSTLAKLRPIAGELLEGGYARLGEEQRRLRVPVAVVVLPRTDTTIDNSRLRRMIRSVCERNGIVVHDLFGAFRNVALDERRVAPWDNHPSEIGHRRIFEALREAILSQGGCPGLGLPVETAWTRRGSSR